MLRPSLPINNTSSKKQAKTYAVASISKSQWRQSIKDDTISTPVRWRTKECYNVVANQYSCLQSTCTIFFSCSCRTDHACEQAT